MRCINALAEFLTNTVPEETILVVRDPDEGRRLLTECAKGGRLPAGVRTATPLMLAGEICAPLLARKGAPRLLTRGEEEDLFFRCLTGMPEKGFFTKAHIRERKTAEMMLATIRELNRELAGPLSGNERLDAVELLREQWQQMKGDRLLDDADLLRTAVRQTEKEEAFPRARFVTLSTEIFPALDLRLIRAAAGERLTVFPVETPEGIRVPERCMGAGKKTVGLERNEIRFLRCRGEETEQKAILREILSAGTAAEECAIVYLSADTIPGLYAAAGMFHLPIVMTEGIPLKDSTVYDALTLVQKWASSDYHAEELRKAVLSGAIRPEAGRSFCRKLRKDNIGWGKERYDALLQPDEKGCPDEVTAKNWKNCLNILFSAAGKSGDPEEQKQDLRELLDNAVGIRREEDARALAAVKKLLEQITWLEEGETVLDRLAALTEQTNVFTGEKEAGHILAVPLTQAFCTGRKNLFFCGLSRFSMQSEEESPILLDEERMRFGLPGKREKEGQKLFRFLLSLAQHEGKSVLSYNDYDMKRMNELSPAPVYRNLLGERSPRVISCVPDEPVTVGDVISTGKRTKIRSAGFAEENCESSARPTELREAKAYEEILSGMAYSASSLETALACPLKFYLQKFVGLMPPSIPERRNDSWLEANEMGTLCHTVLEQYYRDPAEGWEALLQAEIKKLKKTRPEGPESAVQADTEKARQMIERAVRWTEEEGRQVIATEKHFGKNAGEPPLRVNIGDRTLLLSGSIDRIDRAKDGRCAILDYKTGRSNSYRENPAVKLQQYLYARAAETMEPEQKVTEGGYLFLKDTADYLKVEQTPEERGKKEKTILSLLERMEKEENLLTAAPAFVIKTDGSFSETGSAEERQKAFDRCSGSCEFAALCPAKEQIRMQRERELAAKEGSEDDGSASE